MQDGRFAAASTAYVRGSTVRLPMPRRLPPNTLTSREAFFAREAAAWHALTATWADLSDETLLLPGACGTAWSIKDIINHLAAWQEAAMRVINDLLGGRWGRLGPTVETFNAEQYIADQSRPLQESRDRLAYTREALLALLATVSEAQLLNEYGRQQIGWWAKWSTYGHYEQHLADLTAFREQANGRARTLNDNEGGSSSLS